LHPSYPSVSIQPEMIKELSWIFVAYYMYKYPNIIKYLYIFITSYISIYIWSIYIYTYNVYIYMYT
jgi:hypothetical protein